METTSHQNGPHSSQEPLEPYQEIALLLLENGWDCPNDAQWSNLKRIFDKLTRDNAALLNACEMAIGEGDDHKAMKAVMAAIAQAKGDL